MGHSGHHVLEDAQSTEEPHPLQGAGDPELVQLVWRRREGAPVERHGAGRGLHEAADDIEQRRFAGSVGSNHTDDATRRHPERYVIEGYQTTEADSDAVQHQTLRWIALTLCWSQRH